MKNKLFLSALLCTALMLSGCSFGFQGNNNNSSAEEQQYATDGSPESIMNNFVTAVNNDDFDKLSEISGVSFDGSGSQGQDGENQENDEMAANIALMYKAMISSITILETETDYVDTIIGEAKFFVTASVIDMQAFFEQNIQNNGDGEGSFDMNAMVEAMEEFETKTTVSDIPINFQRSRSGEWEIQLNTFFQSIFSYRGPGPDGNRPEAPDDDVNGAEND